MESNEDFWVQYYDGSAWRTIATYVQGAGFANNVFYNKVVSIPAGTYNYPANAKLRFMCDASNNTDDVYIDEIAFRGYSNGKAVQDDHDIVSLKRELVPGKFFFSQNYPNPFKPSTTISFSLPEASSVVIKVFDITGRRVATLADGPYEAGVHNVRWEAKGVSSGIYFCRIQTGAHVATRRMMLLE
ncbi:MAG: T9SS type A sorting domain-containing protein [Candidatus Eisenbacteria bacterium]|uniref:T9SS type A sorting domain-containing protein n=1 Tax=Eiseniibacteriota bacterium TaxID=2212470 RepID=A0A948RVG4_UNCEI|nr:T9SS type A sorting domain-containing protein [Candidatus Eisenbacteria bacterium]MBU1950919.1 T9SS type A sorting domain-containing protein [Candidatus Eisenbacteria bacterium]MBU2691605.1 T9SS type A sorting domain-containing protein [Candidatus Eisenbacteria bacterium]